MDACSAYTGAQEDRPLRRCRTPYDAKRCRVSRLRRYRTNLAPPVTRRLRSLHNPAYTSREIRPSRCSGRHAETPALPAPTPPWSPHRMIHKRVNFRALGLAPAGPLKSKRPLMRWARPKNVSRWPSGANLPIPKEYDRTLGTRASRHLKSVEPARRQSITGTAGSPGTTTAPSRLL